MKPLILILIEEYSIDYAELENENRTSIGFRFQISRFTYTHAYELHFAYRITRNTQDIAQDIAHYELNITQAINIICLPVTV